MFWQAQRGWRREYERINEKQKKMELSILITMA